MACAPPRIASKTGPGTEGRSRSSGRAGPTACPPPPPRPRRRDRPPIPASFRPLASRRRTNGSCRSAREPLPSGRSRTRDWRACRPRFAPPAIRDAATGHGGSPPRGRRRAPGHPPRRRRFSRSALGVAVQQPRHLRREQHFRAARGRLLDRLGQRLRIGSRDRSRCATGRGRSGPWSGGEQLRRACPGVRAQTARRNRRCAPRR